MFSNLLDVSYGFIVAGVGDTEKRANPLFCGTPLAKASSATVGSVITTTDLGAISLEADPPVLRGVTRTESSQTEAAATDMATTITTTVLVAVIR
jgi:hypothetical protein